MDYAKLRSELTLDEGRRKFPYVDTVGKLTIGVGWNLTDRGLPNDIIDQLLQIAVIEAERSVRAAFPQFENITERRQRALVNMAFNLGMPRLRGFKKMWAAILDDNWGKAAHEALDSKWARQVGDRARRLAEMLRSG